MHLFELPKILLCLRIIHGTLHWLNSGKEAQYPLALFSQSWHWFQMKPPEGESYFQYTQGHLLRFFLFFTYCSIIELYGRLTLMPKWNQMVLNLNVFNLDYFFRVNLSSYEWKYKKEMQCNSQPLSSSKALTKNRWNIENLQCNAVMR